MVTTTHIKLKTDIKGRYPFEKQPCPKDEPLPLVVLHGGKQPLG